MAGPAAQARSPLAWLRCLIFLLAAAPASASAGAWIAPEGGQGIWSSAIGQRDGVNFYENAGYLETPLDRNFSVLGSTWLEGNEAAPDGWRGEATFGVKRALPAPMGAALAIQGGAFWMSDQPAGCREGGAEARILAGRSLGQRGYINAEAARRFLDGGCQSNRFDLAAGWRPSTTWLVGVEISYREERGDAYSLGKVTLARFGDDGRGIEFGLRARIDAGEPEPTLIVSFWRGAGG